MAFLLMLPKLVLFYGSPHKLIIAKHSLTEQFFLNGAELTFPEVVKYLGVLFAELKASLFEIEAVLSFFTTPFFVNKDQAR
jgi:hypothetical protein